MIFYSQNSVKVPDIWSGTFAIIEPAKWILSVGD